ncbi:hypothetical protein FQN60_015586 [Etheostoma spectabile]|uniref:Uncharacterized protein n=1 Tax=Etheostoma spectabile TaxID=54343 RepID=A0A5J5CRH9_9PERO|nr:hypothetical protein FQN60_015586 [Etheostoma spectabile]
MEKKEEMETGWYLEAAERGPHCRKRSNGTDKTCNLMGNGHSPGQQFSRRCLNLIQVPDNKRIARDI